jgi:hypothetical protein
MDELRLYIHGALMDQPGRDRALHAAEVGLRRKRQRDGTVLDAGTLPYSVMVGLGPTSTSLEEQD